MLWRERRFRGITLGFRITLASSSSSNVDARTWTTVAMRVSMTIGVAMRRRATTKRMMESDGFCFWGLKFEY
jgi:hypothetical protein